MSRLAGICLASATTALLLIARPASGATTPLQAVEFTVASEAGRATDTPGVAEIDAIFTVAFNRPLGQDEHPRIALYVGDQSLKPAIERAGRWDFPLPNVARLRLALKEILAGGATFEAGSTSLTIRCRVTLGDDSRRWASSTYDFVAQEERDKRPFGAREPVEEPPAVAPPRPPVAPPPVPPAGRPDGAVPATPPGPAARDQRPRDQATRLRPDAAGSSPLREIEPGEVVAEGRIGPAGGRIEAPGAISITFPPGAVAAEESIRVRRARKAPGGALLYFAERPGGDAWFAQPLEVSLSTSPGPGGSPPLAVQQIEGPLFGSVPSGYDPATGTLSFRVIHFSVLGSLFSGLDALTPADIRTMAGAAIGFAVGVWLVTPGGIFSLGGYLVASSLAVAGATLANPAVDALHALGANRVLQFEDDLRIAWAAKEGSLDSLGGTDYHAVADKASGKIIGFLGRGTLTQAQANQAVASFFLSPFLPTALQPGDVYVVPIPQSVLQLAAELYWVRTFYDKATFARTSNGSVPSVPRPLDVLILGASGGYGEWDGSKLNLDPSIVRREWIGVAPVTGKRAGELLPKERPASRQSTVAHEYWHAVFGAAGYQPPFNWWNECMAVALESEVFPGNTNFLSENPLGETAVSLATGLTRTGTADFDSDWQRRGYRLWPWCKFLLHRGYEKVWRSGHNRVTATEMSVMFDGFATSLLSQEDQLPDTRLTQTPTDRYNRPAWFEQFPEGMDRRSFDQSIATTTGWSSLDIGRMITHDLPLGAPGPDAIEAAGPLARSNPLSIAIAETSFAPPERARELARAGTPPPLIVRRSEADPSERIVALHPTRKDPATGRRAAADRIDASSGIGIPSDWWSVEPAVRIPVALIGTATGDTWSQWAGGSNPLWTYFLLPPSEIKLDRSGGWVNFRWKQPDLGPNLEPRQVYSGYRIFLQYEGREPFPITEWLLPAEQDFGAFDASLTDFDRIGLAAEDKVMKDPEDKPLRSPIAWVDQLGMISGTVIKPGSGGGPFSSETLGLPVEGATVVCEYIAKGLPVRRETITSATGAFVFEVPLGPEVTVRYGGESQRVRCTAEAPRQAVSFGGPKLIEVSTEEPYEVIVPPPPTEPLKRPGP